MKGKNIIIAILLLVIGAMAGVFYTNNFTVSKDALAIRTVYEDTKNETSKKTNDLRRQVDPVTSVTDVETATINLFEETAPSVCFISTSKVKQDYWSRNITEIPFGTGSGFIWDEEGHIVTNYHVIQNANKVKVTLSDMSDWDATVVGAEPNKDLAVLKIEAPTSKLKPIKVGKSATLKVGQSVFAIGNPFGLDQTLTTGIISAVGREIKSITGRPIKDVIQTDAAINPGNSGGPLLDSSGRLIGVNTMIYSPSGASAGIGFSIPVDEVNWVVTDLVEFQEVRRPILGVSLVGSQYVKQAGIKGALILDVNENSPAKKAGLRSTTRNNRGEIELGDIIVAVNEEEVESNNDLILSLEEYAPGDNVTISYEREGRIKKVDITLASSINDEIPN